MVKMFMPVILLAALILPPPGSAGTAAAVSNTDLSRHPVYSRYDFGASLRVIDFGTQPLFVPAGVISEVIKRDRILKKALRDIGFEIRFHPFLKGDDINYFLKQGKIDVAMAGDMPTIITASSSDILVTALVQQGFSAIVAKGPVEVTGLKGKRIGYPPVSNAHYTLLAAIASADIKESDVRLVPMEISELVEALAAGRIDAFAAWEPMPSIARKRITNSTIVFKHLNSSYLYFSRPLVVRDPEVAAIVVASEIRALRWLKKNDANLRMAGAWTLAAGETLQGKPVGLTAEEIADLTIQEIQSIALSPTIPERDLKGKGPIRKKFDFLKSRGELAATAEWENVMRSFDRATITSVQANPKKYRLGSFDYDMGKADQ